MDPVQESIVHYEYEKIPVIYWMLTYLAKAKGFHYFSIFGLQLWPIVKIQLCTFTECTHQKLVLDIRLKEKTKIGPRNEGIDQK